MARDVHQATTYARDERHTFETAEDLLAFVEANGYPASAFRP
jgi:hypothetical protein